MVAKNRMGFPAELKKKVPAFIFEMGITERWVYSFVGILISTLSIYGPVVGTPDNNGYRQLLAPLICPPIAAIYFLLTPFNPYTGFIAQSNEMEHRDKLDSEAKHLVTLLGSKDARRFIWSITMKISGGLFLLMTVLTILTRETLNWSLQPVSLIPGFIGGFIGSFLAIGTEYIHWGLRTWADQSSSHHDSN